MHKLWLTWAATWFEGSKTRGHKYCKMYTFNHFSVWRWASSFPQSMPISGHFAWWSTSFSGIAFFSLLFLLDLLVTLNKVMFSTKIAVTFSCFCWHLEFYGPEFQSSRLRRRSCESSYSKCAEKARLISMTSTIKSRDPDIDRFDIPWEYYTFQKWTKFSWFVDVDKWSDDCRVLMRTWQVTSARVWSRRGPPLDAPHSNIQLSASWCVKAGKDELSWLTLDFASSKSMSEADSTWKGVTEYSAWSRENLPFEHICCRDRNVEDDDGPTELWRPPSSIDLCSSWRWWRFSMMGLR